MTGRGAIFPCYKSMNHHNFKVETQHLALLNCPHSFRSSCKHSVCAAAAAAMGTRAAHASPVGTRGNCLACGCNLTAIIASGNEFAANRRALSRPRARAASHGRDEASSVRRGPGGERAVVALRARLGPVNLLIVTVGGWGVGRKLHTAA